MGFRATLRSFFIGENRNDGPTAPVTRVGNEATAAVWRKLAGIADEPVVEQVGVSAIRHTWSGQRGALQVVLLKLLGAATRSRAARSATRACSTASRAGRTPMSKSRRRAQPSHGSFEHNTLAKALQ